jgi:hypothetical protein
VGIFNEPLPSNDKGTFTEPLPGNDRGDHRHRHTHTHGQQRDLISQIYFFKNRKVGQKWVHFGHGKEDEYQSRV